MEGIWSGQNVYNNIVVVDFWGFNDVKYNLNYLRNFKVFNM